MCGLLEVLHVIYLVLTGCILLLPPFQGLGETKAQIGKGSKGRLGHEPCFSPRPSGLEGLTSDAK